MFDVFYFGKKKPGQFVHELPVENFEQAQRQSSTRYFWIITYLADYSDWDFLWEPPPWQSHQRHAWASQWQKDSGTYLVPKHGYQDTNYHPEKIIMGQDLDLWIGTANAETFDFSWHPDFSDPPFNYEFGTQWQKTGGPRYPIAGAQHTKYVSQSRSKIKAQASAVYLIDHLDGNTDNFPVPVIKTSRFFGNYKDTLTRLIRTVPTEHEFVWICSSVCAYETFDFSWHPEAWQNHMLHVFASDDQKFGDTFFMHVPTFRAKIQDYDLLEWYDLNFVPNISIPRHPMPVIQHDHDTHVIAAINENWSAPLALFTNGNNIPDHEVAVSLWREQTKTIVPLSDGASSVIIPKSAVPYIKTQLYDYPYVDRTHRTLKDEPLDIVFISNGEYGAQHHFDVLQDILRTHSAGNRLHHVDGVNGRAAAYQAAATASRTAWFFAVFAKLQVNEDFDWTWQPDRMQQPKHYIFHAYNPVNHLVYGHQAMIAYNKKLVMANKGQGLDFTLDDPHEVVPIVSGTAYYDNDAWTCWRTAFREAIKLRHSLPDVENEYRLQQWLKENNENDYVKWSHIGAQDAMRYYDEVQGDFDSIRQTYEWSWLASYAMMLHPQLITQSRT